MKRRRGRKREGEWKIGREGNMGQNTMMNIGVLVLSLEANFQAFDPVKFSA